MQLSTTSFDNGGVLPARLAFAKVDSARHISLSDNLNPALTWTQPPSGTESFVLICHDPDAPTIGEDVNQLGKTVAYTLPRANFFHWVLVDIPSSRRTIAEGEFSHGVVSGGKPEVLAAPMRHGINDYTAWFATDATMTGQYFGYDGACPPWNDERVHHYIFTLYALSVSRCPLEGVLSGAAVQAAIAPFILAQAQLTARYTLNLALNAD